MEIKLLRDLFRTAIRTPVNDLAKSGIVIVRILHRSRLQVCSPRKKTLLQKRQLQARLKYAKDDLEKSSHCRSHWNCILWSDETKLGLEGRDVAHVWRKQEELYNPKTKQWWEYYAVRMLQCICS